MRSGTLCCRCACLVNGGFWAPRCPRNPRDSKFQTCVPLVEETVFSQIKTAHSRSWSMALGAVLTAAFLPDLTPVADPALTS